MYERFFGLVDAPFRLTPDPRFLYLSRKHADAMAHLRLGLSESSGFVCITGDVGAGKTTLLRSFLANLLPEVSTAYIFNPSLSALELLQTINAEFGLEANTDSKKRLVDALNLHLLSQQIADRRSVVVIDEAQALSVDVLEQLRLLSNLETTTDKLLRIVLVGQPQLRALLRHPELVQLNQRITLRWHLGPLGARETAAYVRHRLAVASRGQAGHVFTRAALWLIYRYSRGVPRLVNMVAHRAMLVAFAHDSRVVTARHTWRAYREIETVPLPVGRAPLRRLAWTAAGIAACLGVIVVGSNRFGWIPPTTPHDTVAAPAPVTRADALGAGAPMPAPERNDPFEVAAAVPPAAVPDEVSPDADAPDAAPSDGDLGARGVAAPPADGEDTQVAALVAEPPAEEPASGAPAPTAVAAVEPPAAPEPPAAAAPAPLVTAEAAKRLAAVAEDTSARDAVDALLAAWQASPLSAGESSAPSALGGVAARRQLEFLPLVANASMLRLLDLPAILELRLDGAEGPRWVTLTGVGDGGVVLAIAGEPTPVESAFLERHWFGQAYLLWRDFEGLGPTTLKPRMRGAAVERLQALLARIGAYGGPANGLFDEPTVAAVTEFQRSRLLEPDAQVGRFTRIVLYAAAGGYRRPTLAAQPGDAS
jgi:general secretion pathway protein A